jgi:hypothetical protein
MLSFRGASVSRFCTGLSRRDFLKVGALGIGGLTLAELLRCRAHAKATGSSKAVIFVYLHGGPSHIDTYDMNSSRFRRMCRVSRSAS